MNYKIFLIILSFAGSKLLHAQEHWVFKTESEGIKVYNNILSAAKVKPIKVECTFNATASQLVAVLLDIKHYTDWVYKTKLTTLIKQVSPAELYYYAEIDMPWPAQNRDFAAHITVSQNRDTKVVTVDAPSVVGLVPEKDNIFRIHESKGKWVITPVGNDRVNVTYFLQIDPGGAAPAWLINIFIAEGPLQSFKKLKLQVQKSAYKSISLPFIHN
ncbi:MAG: lipid-binding protein [Mucilaginibacter sp.]|nr:lipid-binding protein [Mucilaginibacter sp.]